MAEVTCHICSAVMAEDDRFCRACGARVTMTDDTSTIPVATAAPQTHTPAVGTTQSDLPAGVAALVVQRGPDAGTRFLLAGKDDFTIGRDSDSDIFLDDVTVSRRHASVTRASENWALSDAGSLNGTYVNGQRTAHVDLREGDNVTIGKFHFTFHLGSNT